MGVPLLQSLHARFTLLAALVVTKLLAVILRLAGQGQPLGLLAQGGQALGVELGDIARAVAQGQIAALVMTVMIQIVAAASLYALILGYSRIPFAAAREGQFFKVFAALHPTKAFPHVALLTVGLLAVPFCFFSLGQLATWIMQVQVLLCFLWQCAGVILLYRHRKDVPQPFVMWLYPLPAIVSFGLWFYIYLSGSKEGIAFSIVYLAASVAAYVAFRNHQLKKAAGGPASI